MGKPIAESGCGDGIVYVDKPISGVVQRCLETDLRACSAAKDVGQRQRLSIVVERENSPSAYAGKGGCKGDIHRAALTGSDIGSCATGAAGNNGEVLAGNSSVVAIKVAGVEPAAKVSVIGFAALAVPMLTAPKSTGAAPEAVAAAPTETMPTACAET